MDNSGSVEALRASIEKAYRFKESFRGYDKDSVHDYINSLNTDYKRLTSSLEAEIERLKAVNAELNVKLQTEEAIIDEYRNGERRRRETEQNMHDSMVDSLREINRKLTEENHRKQLEITNLQERFGKVSSYLTESSSSLDALSVSLKKMLSDKLGECGDIIEAWHTEYTGVIEQTNRNINL